MENGHIAQTSGQNVYYNKEIIAIITITERNFNAANVQVFTSAGENIGEAPIISDFSDNKGNQFTLDLTEPGLENKNIENNSADKGDVRPVITYTGVNYDQSLVSISVVKANSGGSNLKTIGDTISDVKNGRQ